MSVVAVNELAAPLIVSIQAEMVELTCYHEISLGFDNLQLYGDVSKHVEIRIALLGRMLNIEKICWHLKIIFSYRKFTNNNNNVVLM